MQRSGSVATLQLQGRRFDPDGVSVRVLLVGFLWVLRFLLIYLKTLGDKLPLVGGWVCAGWCSA